MKAQTQNQILSPVMKLRKTLPALLTIACILSGCMESDEDKFQKALSLYTKSTSNQQAIKSAHVLLEELAAKEHPKAEYMLALMYYRGDGVIADNNKALALLLSSSAHGNGDASYLASNFYSLPDYGQTPDAEKAKTLLAKSARDGSEIGQLNLGDKYFHSDPGYPRNVQYAYEQLVKIKEGPYRDGAALTLYNIYSEPNQPLYSPEKATKEIERLAASTKNSVFLGLLAGIYAGKEFGAQAPTVIDSDKLSALINEYEKSGSRQAVVLMKFKAGLLSSDQLLPTMVDALKETAIDAMFAHVFCLTQAAVYTAEKPDPSLDINDIVKACTPGAEQNNNYAQYVLATAYYRQKQYDDAYKWAYVSSKNGNQYARTMANLAAGYLGARVGSLTPGAERLQKVLSNATAPKLLPEYSVPWYAPAANAVQ